MAYCTNMNRDEYFIILDKGVLTLEGNTKLPLQKVFSAIGTDNRRLKGVCGPFTPGPCMMMWR